MCLKPRKSNGTERGNPILAYIFISVLAIIFTMIKTNPNTQVSIYLTITSYALVMLMIQSFYKDINSATEIIKTFDYLSLFS